VIYSWGGYRGGGRTLAPPDGFRGGGRIQNSFLVALKRKNLVQNRKNIYILKIFPFSFCS